MFSVTLITPGPTLTLLPPTPLVHAPFPSRDLDVPPSNLAPSNPTPPGPTGPLRLVDDFQDDPFAPR